MMNRRNTREILYEILADYGHSDWVVLETNQTDDANYVLCNFIKRRKVEIAIPDEWFEEPRRYQAMEELVILAIANSSPMSSQATAHELLLRSRRAMGITSN